MTCYKAFIINHKQSPFNEPFPLFDDCIFHQRFSIVSFGHFGLFSSRKGLANNLFSLCKIILSSFFYKDKFIRASSKKNVGEKPNDDKIWAKLHQSVSFTICKFRGQVQVRAETLTKARLCLLFPWKQRVKSQPTSIFVWVDKNRTHFSIFVEYLRTYTMAENQEGGTAQESGGYDYKRLHSYPLIRVS